MTNTQHTLAQPVSVKGIGVHMGVEAEVTLHPAPANSGIVFVRTDEGNVEIPISPEAVVETTLCSKLSNDSGMTIMTVEHLMAALYGLGVDNARIEIAGPEIPILDGSAQPWVELIDQAGLKDQGVERDILVIQEPVTLEIEGRVVQAVPDPRPGLRIEVMIDFPHPAIGRQEAKFAVTEENFRKEIAPARTFCQQKDVEAMERAGLIKGGSLDCAVVFSEDGTIANEYGLRFADEPVRHKLLDAVGDLYLGGKRIQGKLSIPMPGHGVNNKLLRALIS